MSQHLAVELFRGRIRVSYDVGNQPVSTMFSYEILSDGRYHRVELIAVKKNFTLRVDGGLARSIVNDGKNEKKYFSMNSLLCVGDNEYLNVRSSMFIAGVSAGAGEQALKLWHLRNSTSFNGETQG